MKQASSVQIADDDVVAMSGGDDHSRVVFDVISSGAHHSASAPMAFSEVRPSSITSQMVTTF